jgi:hypothetical protein
MAQPIQQSPLTGPIGSGILNYFDAIKDDYDKIEYFPFGDEYFSLMNIIMNYLGQREVAKNKLVKWFERQRQEVPFSSNGTVNIASGVYTITLPTAEVDPDTGYSWPIQYEIWEHAKTGKQFQIISKPASNTLVLQPSDSTTSITVNAGDQFFFVSNSQPEGSRATQPKIIFDEQYQAALQTVRNDSNTTAEAMFNQLWYDEQQDGKAVPFSNSRDVTYMQRQHLVALINGFLGMQNADNLSTTTSFQTTDGIVPIIKQRGQLQDTGGSIDVTDFYSLEAKLSKQNGGIKDYMILMSGKVSAQLEQALLTYNQNANIGINKASISKTFWAEQATAERMSVSYSFQSTVFNNKNFDMYRLGILDNPQSFNTTDSVWQDYGIVIPKTQGGVDDGLGSMGRFVRVVTKPGLFMKIWTTGGMSPVNQTDYLGMQAHIASEIAYKFVNANNYGLFYKA